ncbi:hypothetical protein Mame01_07830 [Microbispora amethystogenes]|nr:hypothetical protein Mame01_07830 [Microbispora amethystogenes]
MSRAATGAAVTPVTSTAAAQIVSARLSGAFMGGVLYRGRRCGPLHPYPAGSGPIRHAVSGSGHSPDAAMTAGDRVRA